MLTSNCPVIEEIYLANCKNLNDSSIELISDRLLRLRILDISWCKKLTKLSEYALWKSKSLRCIYAQGQECLGISIILIFATIKTLHVFKVEETFTRNDFENRKYSTTSQRKFQTLRRCLAFIR